MDTPLLNCKPWLLLKVGPGDYIFVKNPIVVYEERGDITRVSIHVKPTAKQGVPEVSEAASEPVVIHGWHTDLFPNSIVKFRF